MVSFAIGKRLKKSLLPKPVPSMLEWAQATIVVPDGPHKGQLFDVNTQPFSRLLLSEIDSGRWDRIVATGPTQTGKSLIAYVIPVLYHLFAVGETVVAGLPTLDLADDKWQQDFLPVIESSPELRRQLPTTGPGSRSGKVTTRVKFRNGATLRFLTGGGSDKSRAGFTSRVLAVTEVDGLDEASRTSREADKLKQMEARQRAFLQVGTRTYLECTVTTTLGRIWQEYTGGTESRIARPCPHCQAYVTPAREHLIGWQDAQNEVEARQNTTWSCPACARPWSEQERYKANLRSVLLHRGQEIRGNRVVGSSPPTRTLGFRWTAVDNHFATAADVAADEWSAQREADRENAEKELRQFVHCIPHDPPEIELTPLDADAVASRTTSLKRGIVPAECVGVSVGVDTGKRLLHWTAIAWLPSGGGRIIDYGSQTVLSDKLGTRQGLVSALRTLKNYFDRGWRSDSDPWVPSQVWIDSGYHEHTDAVYEFCGEASAGLAPGAAVYRPSKGYGAGQRRLERYVAPKGTNRTVCYVSRGYHLTWLPRGRLLVAHVNSDHWKSELHQRLSLPADTEQAITLFEVADWSEHREFADHLTAERQVEKWKAGQGESIVWERIRRQNHYLDSTYAALAAGDLVLALQARLVGQPVSRSFSRQLSDDKPFLASARPNS